MGSATFDSYVGAGHHDADIDLTARVKKPPDRIYSNYEEFKDRKVKELDIAKSALKELIAEAVTALAEDDSCVDVHVIAGNIELDARIKKPPDGRFSMNQNLVKELMPDDSCIDGEQHLLGGAHANKGYHDPPLTRVKKPPDKMVNIGQVEESFNKFVFIASVPIIVIKILTEQSQQPSIDLLVL